VLRRQSLIRAIANRVGQRASAHQPNHHVSGDRCLYQFADRRHQFSNSEVVKFATRFGVMNSRTGIFLMAPTCTVAGKNYLSPSLAGQPWTAIGQDSIAAFAKRYPATVTPDAPP
jgi:hypothetical protein